MKLVPCLIALIALATLVSGPLATAQTTVRASVDNTGTGQPGWSRDADISDDGRHVVFRASADLAPNANPARYNAYSRDLQLGTTTTLDVTPTGGMTNGNALEVHVSSNGRFVAIYTEANNLAPTWGSGVVHRDRDPDNDGIFDEGNEVNTLVSINTSGNAGWPIAGGAAISGNGRHVAFVTNASDIVTGDTNTFADVFVRDTVLNTTVRVSVGSGGIEGNGSSIQPSLSHTGRYVAFASNATNFGVGHSGWYDIFRHDRDPDGNGVFDEGNGITELLSPQWDGPGSSNNNSNNPSISANGDRVAYVSGATNLVPGFIYSDARIYLRNVPLGGTQLVSVSNTGNSAWTHSWGANISPDGRFVGFYTASDNLVSGDTNGAHDIYLRDTIGYQTWRASLGATGNEPEYDCTVPAVSFGAQVIAFDTASSNMVGGDVNGNLDVFARSGVLPPCVDASWINYGSGLAGTLGVPGLEPSADPVLGSSFTIDVENSLGTPTLAIVVVGTSTANLPFKGGLLLVQPEALYTLSLPAAGMAMPASLPADMAACGLGYYLQVIQVDAGGPLGVSLTEGLALTVGL